jgi:hypothetical protein
MGGKSSLLQEIWFSSARHLLMYLEGLGSSTRNVSLVRSDISKSGVCEGSSLATSDLAGTIATFGLAGHCSSI